VADPKTEGPRHKAWRERYKALVGQKLRAEGFTPDEIEKIIDEFVDGLTSWFWGMIEFIVDQIRRMLRAKRAIEDARREVGDPPQFEE